jgi:hypothetical protein
MWVIETVSIHGRRRFGEKRWKERERRKKEETESLEKAFPFFLLFFSVLDQVQTQQLKGSMLCVEMEP